LAYLPQGCSASGSGILALFRRQVPAIRSSRKNGKFASSHSTYSDAGLLTEDKLMPEAFSAVNFLPKTTKNY